MSKQLSKRGVRVHQVGNQLRFEVLGKKGITAGVKAELTVDKKPTPEQKANLKQLLDDNM